VTFHHSFSKPQPAKNASNSMPGMDMPGMDMKSMPTMPAMPMHMSEEPATDLSTTLLWGRTRSLTDNTKENSYLAEALLRFAHSNYAWTRMENAGRSNELLLTPGSPLPPAFVESPLGHVAAYSFGYDHDLRIGKHLLAAPGAQFTLYRAPQKLQPVYGSTPTAEVFFIRFRLH